MTKIEYIASIPPEERTGEHWVLLLKSDDKYASICNWEKLSGKDWSSLLAEKPHFIAIVVISVSASFIRRVFA